MYRLLLPFVGREKELEFLSRRAERARQGSGSTVLLTGECGVGKTRLSEELIKICQKEEFAVLSSLCLGEKEPPYFPVTTALENYSKSLAEKDAYVPLGLSGFQEIEIEEKTPVGLVRERTRVMEFLLTQFLGIARTRPLVFFIDDLHLADSATLGFFHYLARNIKNERIFVIATYVEEHAEGENQFGKTLRNMNIERICTTLKLENFSEREVKLIVEAAGFREAGEIAGYIYERTSGNPFFVVEFLTALQSLGLREMEAIKRMELPGSVREFVKFRVSRLGEKAKKVLATASLLSRVFEYSVLKELASMEEGELLDAIEELVAQNYLIETEEFEEGYKFRSNTVREVVYGDISGTRKRVFHQKAGEAIERLHSSDENWWGTIARHYASAGNKEKFVEYGLKAGKLAARRFANAEAVEFFEGVLKALGAEKEERAIKVEVLGELAGVLELEGRFDEALEALNERTGLIQNPVEAGENYRRKSGIYIYKGDYENAWREAEKAEQELTGLKEGELELGRVWSTKAYVLERRGDYRRAIELQESALELFERYKAEKEEGNALHRIGTCYWYMGDYERALEFLEKALKIREKINDVNGLAATSNNIGIIWRDRGVHQKALEWYNKSLRLWERIGNIWGIATTRHNIGIIYLDKGEYAKALEHYTKDLEICERLGDLWGIALACNNLGVVYGVMGDNEKALEFYRKSLEIREKIRDVHGIIYSYRGLAELYLELDDYERALMFYQKAMDIASKIEASSDACSAGIGIAEVYIAKGELENGAEHLKEGKELAEELGEKETAAYAWYLEGILHAKRGEIARAIECLREALRVYEDVGIEDFSYYKAMLELGRLTEDRNLVEKVCQFFEGIGNRKWAGKAKEILRAIECEQ
ncbi:MAG: tetratricopeptide repeat protein [Thermoplasmata archaeon]